MLINEVITESLSRIAYHYTRLPAALKILQSGNFELSSALGSNEEHHMPKGMPYFMSATRTKLGGYHREKVSTRGVMFVLDGNWFNNHYKSAPVDYWRNREPGWNARAHEAEDRIYSPENTIPINGVTSMHVLYEADPEDTSKTELHNRAITREVLLAGKTRGIPTYFYTDRKSWLDMDRRHLGDVKVLTGQRMKGWAQPKKKAVYLSGWFELLRAHDKNHLTDNAKKTLRGLVQQDGIDDAYNALEMAFSSARQPSDNMLAQDREILVKIVAYMRQNRIPDIKELINHVMDKWTNILSKPAPTA
jgi:hypothetical protein